MENNSRIDDRRLAGEEKRTANDGKDMWDLPPLAYHVSCLMADTVLSFVNKSFSVCSSRAMAAALVVQTEEKNRSAKR